MNWITTTWRWITSLLGFGGPAVTLNIRLQCVCEPGPPHYNLYIHTPSAVSRGGRSAPMINNWTDKRFTVVAVHPVSGCEGPTRWQFDRIQWGPLRIDGPFDVRELEQRLVGLVLPPGSTVRVELQRVR